MPDVKVSFAWRRHPGGRPTARLRERAVSVLGRVGIDGVEVGVLVCDDRAIRALNRSYRGKDAATDVLSFPSGDRLPEGGSYLGDIAISLDTAGREAQAAGIGTIEEIERLLIHGLLHLAGFDHETDGGEMRALERTIRRKERR